MTYKLALREMQDDDLVVLFRQQLNPEANWMAAFTSKDPTDEAAFRAHWAKVRADPGVTNRIILCDGAVAGSLTCHGWFGDPEISYWLGREFWGRGIATWGVTAFLEVLSVRPLYARAVHDNVASIRVLEKCGFVKTGEDSGFSNARQMDVKEVVMMLGGES